MVRAVCTFVWNSAGTACFVIALGEVVTAGTCGAPEYTRWLGRECYFAMASMTLCGAMVGIILVSL